ncbi:MAG: hypothetical protein JWQ98_2658 [Chlorobi bacterium]|nr:hypothetical protein [Chlorobiota bacterium]
MRSTSRTPALFRAFILAGYFAALLALGVASSGRLLAQGGEDYDFSNIPIGSTAHTYIAFGGGYLGMVPLMKYDALNHIASDSLGLASFQGPLILNGGGAFISIFIVPNVRMGAYGMSGSKMVEKTITIPSDNAAYKRTFRFSNSVTAVQLDYVFRVLGNLIVAPGAMIGGVSNTLEETQTKTQDAQFGGLLVGSQTQQNHYAKITNSSLFYYPAVNVEYSFTKFVMLRAGFGYAGSASIGTWTDGADVDIQNVPAIRSDGFAVQFGVMVGVFQNF